jgi:hypothetical protein
MRLRSDGTDAIDMDCAVQRSKKVSGTFREAISDRGGVLGAMDTMYQRGKTKGVGSFTQIDR